MGGFQPLYDLIKPFFGDAQTFLQSIAIFIATAVAIYYKIREMGGNPQEDQMYSQKTNKVLIGLAVVFIIPTGAKILQTYFL
ncbi:hypothetical protein [Breznakia pachnodae]|uniref:Uncharacterized protein n=1 Tax=Breznakia pachnodae TaxID=265178 RepID=A0ABU0E4C2_9FIRM|nr:hypothetical protein [Breznakia pachnodae]MDQ0361566.1 hypothetical protein [Breznakia pachnodae]